MPILSDIIITLAKNPRIVESITTPGRMLNPSTYRLEDLSGMPFKEAHDFARKNNQKAFKHNGNRYTTEVAGDGREEMKKYGILYKQMVHNPSQERLNLSNMPTKDGYGTKPSTVLKAMLGLYNQTQPIEESTESYRGRVAEADAWRLYLGVPQKNNSFEPSDFDKDALQLTGYNNDLPKDLPSDKTISYYGDALYADEFNDDDAKKVGAEPYVPSVEIYKTLTKEYETALNSGDLPKAKDLAAKINTFHPEDHTKSNPIKPWGDYTMGRHYVTKGNDSSGNYIEYKDYWNLADDDNPITTAIEAVMGKPFKIQGRKYYGTGTNKPKILLNKQ